MSWLPVLYNADMLNLMKAFLFPSIEAIMLRNLKVNATLEETGVQDYEMTDSTIRQSKRMRYHAMATSCFEVSSARHSHPHQQLRPSHKRR